MKKKSRYIFIACLPVIFIIVFLILIISSSAAGSSGATGDDETLYSVIENTAEYSIVLGLEEEYGIKAYQIYVLYILTNSNSFNEEELRTASSWIAQNGTSDEVIANYYFTTEPYATKLNVSSVEEIVSAMQDANTILSYKTTSSTLPTTDANVDGTAYQELNPFTQAGYRGQCTWYCWGRVFEVTGKRMPTGNAQNWYFTTSLPKGREARAGAVAVFSGGAFGHVAYIEKVENGIITYSEGNYANPYANTSYGVYYAQTHYKELLHKASINESSFQYVNLNSGLRLVGYIYP